LGGIEFEMMEIVWAHGECTVRDVLPFLPRPRAHSTVVSALDRLCRKGFLDRRSGETAYIYSPRFSREEWTRQMVGNLVAVTQASAVPRSEVASFLVESIAQNDESLLDKLLEKIEARRREIEESGKP
jgi:predicted transcriptional regulator